MQLRRFTADSTPAALGAVRVALGDDAIILANRKIGDQVEIIATGQMDDAQSLSEISLDASVPHLEHGSAVNNADNGEAKHSANLLAGVTQAESRIKASPRNNHSRPPSFDEITAALDAEEDSERPSLEKTVGSTIDSDDSVASLHQHGLNGNGSERNYIEDEVDAHKDLAPRGAQSAHLLDTADVRDRALSSTAPGVDNDLLKDEMHDLSSNLNDALARHNQQLTDIIEQQNSMINQYFKGLEVNLWGNSSPNRRLHLQRLLTLGLGAELAIQLVERADPTLSVDAASRQSFALLKSTLPIGVDKTFSVPGVTIMSGPPGAGKTTALMKIAMQHVKEHGSDSIVVICADTRRIGAFEELQAYGRLLGVPTVHAHDSSELESLLSAFTHKQLILIDHTLPNDSDAVEIPQCLLKPKQADTVRQLLVLSATSQSSTIDALIKQHYDGRSMQCVLTHLDASARLGELFNAIIRHHLPIAYWSDAASVQKPLQKADASVLIATAVAMTRRLSFTPDDEWLMRLIQPSDELMSQPGYPTESKEVNS